MTRKNIRWFISLNIVLLCLLTLSIKSSAYEGNIYRDKDSMRLEEMIALIEDYYNIVHFRQNNGTLEPGEIAAFKKAGLEINKGWRLKEDLIPSYDTNLKYLGNKADQAISMIEQGRDPADYKGRNLINEIIVELNNEDYGHADSKYLRGVIAANKYNKLFDSSLTYNADVVLKNIKLAQKSDGGFRERKDSVLPNTGYALEALAYINLPKEKLVNKELMISEAVRYIKSNQKDDGAFYLKTYNTNNNIQVIKGLLAVGENLISDKWTVKGKNPIDSMFILYRGDGSFDAAEGESVNNRGWIKATQNTLYCLGLLKERNYGNYMVNNINKNDAIGEKEVEVYVTIVLGNIDGSMNILYEPSKVKINNIKNVRGVTPLGALEEITSMYEMQGSAINSIYGIENKDLGGWLYGVNGKVLVDLPGEYELSHGDKVVWFYNSLGNDINLPSWEDIILESSKEYDGIVIITNKNMKNNKEVIFKIDKNTGNFSYGLVNIKTGEVVNMISVSDNDSKGEYRFLVPSEGNYMIKNNI